MSNPDYRALCNECPITPPPELVREQLGAYFGTTLTGEVSTVELALATAAARWGADQELEACCEVLARELICDGKHVATDLRMIRRPKPPSLNVVTKEQALSEVAAAVAGGNITPERGAAIRRALEALDD